MSDLRDALGRIVAPAPSPSFHDGLRDRIQASQRARVRRWRAVALVTTAAAIAAASAVGVLAVGRASGGATTVDRTLSCRLPTVLGGTRFQVYARVDEPAVHQLGKTLPRPGGVGVDNGYQPEHLYAAASKLIGVEMPGYTINVVKDGYLFDKDYCTSARPIPLARSGLPSLGVFSRAGNVGFNIECNVGAAPPTIRMRVVLAKPGTPVAAQLVVRAGKAQRPVAFVDWTPTRVTAFASPACQQR